MKKLKSTLIFTLLSLSLIGCGMTAETDNNAAPNTTTETTDIASNSESPESLEKLKQAVSETISKSRNITATGSMEENKTRFFELRQELDELDSRLEIFEDALENKYKNGNLSFDEYRSQNNAIENLENELEKAEDYLETVFGFED